MKKLALLALCASAAALFSGCSSIEKSTKFSGLSITENRSVPVAHINGKVTGIYLFNTVPIFSGNTYAIGKCAFMKDTLNIEDAIKMVTRTARGYGATKIVDLHSEYEETWLWPTLIFWEREINVSGNAIK